MVKPVLLAVDDDREVLNAVRRDLNRKYGEEYRIVAAPSGPSALDALTQLHERDEPVALFLVDQRMPEMSGVEFLERARPLYPDAKRVLLTAYADTEAAIRAINTVKVDYYLMKPWDPPEEYLYPVLDDQLYDWKQDYRPPFEGLRILGHRWSAQAHDIKDFLARNRIPFCWLDIEREEEACRLMDQLKLESVHLPVIVFEDRSYLVNPTPAQIAEKIGTQFRLQTRPQQSFYDVIIVGGGPAGLGAAVYAASEGLNTVLIDRSATGGQAGTTSKIENYLGFPDGISGSLLAQRAVDQALKFKAEILVPQEVVGVRVEEPYRIALLADGSEISSYAMILASGLAWRRLDVPGMDRLTGAGIYYGASRTEAPLCQDEEIYIVGGANSAGQAAMDFSKYATKVTMLVRGASLSSSMSHYLIEQIQATPNIIVRTHCNVVRVDGDERLESITLRDAATGAEETVLTSSLFILIGAEPCTDWLQSVVERDERGFIYSGPQLMRDGKRPTGWPLDRDPYLLETSVPGIFVAGDVRSNSVKRCAVGVGSGSMAVQFVHQYLETVR